MNKDDIIQLIHLKTENKNVDYKCSIHWGNSSNEDKIGIIKDIIAMSNTQDGGKIIFGINDPDYVFLGMIQDDYESFDPTNINDFLQKFVDPKISCQVFKFNDIDGKCVVVIDVPEFNEIPTLCIRNAYNQNNKLLLQEGQIYIRTEKATSEPISNATEMREFLGRALSKKGDELLNSISRLLKGKPLIYQQPQDDFYKDEINKSIIFFKSKLENSMNDYGYWQLISYPQKYDPNRFNNQILIKDKILQSEVNLRGWNFPHTDVKNASNFQSGRQSHTIWERFIEAYQIFQSGLFVWKGAFQEDVVHLDGTPVLSFINSIYMVTEYFLFLKRFYENIIPDSEYLNVKVQLFNVHNRKLISSKTENTLLGNYITNEPTIFIESSINYSYLKSSFKDIALEEIKKIFLLFNWDNITDETINHWQKNLLEKNI